MLSLSKIDHSPSVAILAQAFAVAQDTRMASDDEFISFGLAARAGGDSDGSEEILSFPASSAAVGSSRVGAAASREALRRGTFGAFLLSHVASGPVSAGGDSVVDDAPEQLSCIGICICDWSFKEPSAALVETHRTLSSGRVAPAPQTTWGVCALRSGRGVEAVPFGSGPGGPHFEHRSGSGCYSPGSRGCRARRCHHCSKCGCVSRCATCFH